MTLLWSLAVVYMIAGLTGTGWDGKRGDFDVLKLACLNDDKGTWNHDKGNWNGGEKISEYKIIIAASFKIVL